MGPIIFKVIKNNMSYYISKTVEGDFSAIEKRIVEKLQEEEFGVISEINMQNSLKEKLDVDFRKYKILGVCNPAFAYESLQSEDKIGTLLPCNIIIQEIEPGQIEITSVDPEASMRAVENPDLQRIASSVKEKLSRVINSFY